MLELGTIGREKGLGDNWKGRGVWDLWVFRREKGLGACRYLERKRGVGIVAIW